MLNFLLKRKMIVGLLIVFIIGIGIYSIKKLDQELFPDVSFNQTLIFVQTEEMPSEDVESYVTIPIEQALANIEGVKEYESSTTTDNSTIMIQAKDGEDDLTNTIEAEINRIKGDLYGVKETTVLQASTNGGFDLFLDLSGADMDELTNLATDTIEPRLEALPEVGNIQIDGLREQEVHITLKPKALTEHGINKEEIVAMIGQTNQNATVGAFQDEANKPSLRWNTSLTSLEDIKNMTLPTETGTIHLSDIAKIEEVDSEGSSIAWKNGKSDFLIIQVGRANGYSQIDMTQAVRDEIKAIESDTSSEAKIHEIAAQADYVENALDGITSNIVIGGIIAIIVLLLFLRNIRATIIIGLSIPTSILLTLITMTMFDYSLNILSLIGLGLGIGMMVDASIVVLESIFQKKEQGFGNKKAVLQGTKEVVGAIISSALTTIVVFVPIVLLDDDIGKMIVILTVVIAVTLISSVIIAFTLIPVLSENFLRVKRRKKQRFLIKTTYGNLLEWLTEKKRRRYGIISLFILIFFGSFFLLNKIPVTFMPDILNRYAEVMIELEPGVSKETKEEIVLDINENLSEIPDIESNIVLDNSGMLFTLVNMTPEEEKTLEQKEINEQIFENLNALKDDYPIRSIGSTMEGATNPPVEIRVTGEDLATLQTIGEKLDGKLKEVDGVTTTQLQMGEQKEEYTIKLDEEQMEQDDIPETYLFSEISNLFFDQQIGEVAFDGKDMAMIMKNDISIQDHEGLLGQKIVTADGENKLSEYISLEKTKMPYQIDRMNGDRYISITAEYEGQDIAGLNKEVSNLLKDLDVDEGYTATVAGDLEAQQNAAMELLVIFAISLFLVFVVMAIQFNSIKHPFIILMIIPLTITGVLIGMFVTQKDLNILSAIGVIMLIGIVINNGILLIDRVRQFREQGIGAADALVRAGKERIRPIFMTTLTTVGGMLPLAMATDSSSGYQSPLAVVLISGLLFSTLITLVLIPAIYLAFEDVGRGLRKVFGKNKIEGPKEIIQHRTS